MSAATIEKRRTRHGGAGSALSIELAPVRRCTMLGAVPAGPGTDGEGWAVYIRNPLPLLIRAEWPAVDPAGSAPAANKARSMSLARTRAATFADELADHLGAKLSDAATVPATVRESSR